MAYALCTGMALVLLGGGCAKPASNAPAANNEPVQKPAGPISVGFLGPLSGDAANLGQDALKAAQAAVEEINAAGGINGAELKLIAEDGKCNPKDSATAGNKLINVDKVPVVFGGLCSGETTAIAPVAEQNKVIVISGCSSAPSITTAGDYIFRSYPSDALQGKFAADYVYKTLGKKKVTTLAVLGDWGSGLKNAFEDAFRAQGGEIVLSQDYVQEARDLRSQLTKAKDSGAELLYFVGYTEASIAGLKQAKELGLAFTIMGGDAWDDVKIHENSFADGILYTVGSAKFDENWAAKLKEKGGNPTLCTPRTYDNIKIIADIMKQTGPDSTKIKDALYALKDYQGVGGIVTLDVNGDNTFGTFDVKMVDKGKAEVITQ